MFRNGQTREDPVVKTKDPIIRNQNCRGYFVKKLRFNVSPGKDDHSGIILFCLYCSTKSWIRSICAKSLL